MAFALRVLGLLPLTVLYALGRFASFVAYDLMKLARSRSPTENLARSLPERTADERREILARSYRNLGSTLAEGIWGWRANGDALRQRVTIDNRALIDALHRGTANRACCLRPTCATGSG